MTKKQEIKQIAEELQFLLSKYEENRKHQDSQWKEAFLSVLDDIERDVSNTKLLQEDFADKQLSINMIETEGYMRGLLACIDTLKVSMSYIQENEE